MKKEYQKPELEVISLVSTEKLTDDELIPGTPGYESTNDF